MKKGKSIMKKILLSLLFMSFCVGKIVASDEESIDEFMMDWLEGGHLGDSSDDEVDGFVLVNPYRSSPGIINRRVRFKYNNGKSNKVKSIDLSDLYDFESLQRRLRNAFDLDDYDNIIFLDQEGKTIESLEGLKKYLEEKAKFRPRNRLEFISFTVESSEEQQASSSFSPEAEVPLFLKKSKLLGAPWRSFNPDRFLGLQEPNISDESSSEPVTPRELFPLTKPAVFEKIEEISGDGDDEEASMDYLTFDRDIVLKVIEKLAQSEDFARNFNRIFKESQVLMGLVEDLFRKFPDYF